VLLVSAEDDRLWDATRLTRIAEVRADREGAGDRLTHVAYPDAGHMIGNPPGFPIRTGLVDGERTIAFGGSRAGDQAARVDSWRRLLELVEAPVR
jgi:uncharacterized protein